jgi:hypothetical protein
MLTHCKQKPATSTRAIEKVADINIEIPGPRRLFDGETLTNWKITNFGPQGEVYVSDDEIILGMGDGCTGITWTDSFPKVNYEISLEAKRIMGIDFFCGLTFPVKMISARLLLGVGEAHWSGLVPSMAGMLPRTKPLH